MKISFGFRLAGLSVCMFLFGTTLSAAQYQIPPEVLAYVQAQQRVAQTNPQPTACSSIAPSIPCTTIATEARPQFSNSDWSTALLQGTKKTLFHAAALFVILKLPSYIAPSWFPGTSSQRLGMSSALFWALTTLSLRYKEQIMKRFETENGCETAIGLTSSLLPGLPPKMLLAAGAGAFYFALNGPSYQ